MERAKGQLNFNSVVSLIVLAVVVWVGASIQQHTSKLADISQDVAVLKSTVDGQKHELNELTVEYREQSHVIAQIQWDVGGRRRANSADSTAPAEPQRKP